MKVKVYLCPVNVGAILLRMVMVVNHISDRPNLMAGAEQHANVI